MVRRSLGIVADKSSIEWTEATWNPTTGCDRISPGCDNCYALTLAKRLKGMGNPKYQVDGDPRTSGPGFGVQSTKMRWTADTMAGSSDDLRGQHVGSLARACPDRLHCSRLRHHGRYPSAHLSAPHQEASSPDKDGPRPSVAANVWVGVSVETQRQAWRVDELRKVPAAVLHLR